MIRRTLKAYPLTLAAFIVGLALLTWFPKWIADDAFIYFRYAENLALHGELTWNVGHDPIEGYTGALLPLMLAAGIKLGIPPATASMVIGILSMLAGGFLILLILLRLGANEILRGSILALYFTTPILYTHATNGMETMLFIALILTCFYAALEVLEAGNKPGRRESWLALAWLGVSLARPEGVMLAGASLVAVVLGLRIYNEDRLRPLLLRTFLFFVLPGVLYFAWRIWYYGHWLPNTFYAKTFPGTMNMAVMMNLISFLLHYLTIPVLAAPIVLALGLTGSRSEQKVVWSGKFWLVFAAFFAFALVIIAQYLRSRLVMNFSFRFWAPLVPIVLLGVAGLIHHGLSLATGAVRRRFATALLLLFVIGQVVSNFARLPDEFSFTSNFILLHDHAHVPAGKYVQEHIPPDQWLAVLIDAGRIPYYAKRPTLDFGALNDEYLARENPSSAQLADYFFTHQPAAAVISSNEWDHVQSHWEARAIVRDPRFAEQYRLVKKYRTPSKIKSYEFIYLRRDLVPAHL